MDMTIDSYLTGFDARKVDKTYITEDIRVSTVELWPDTGTWETTVLADRHPEIHGPDGAPGYAVRYDTIEEARAGHVEMVAKVQAWVDQRLNRHTEGNNR